MMKKKKILYMNKERPSIFPHLRCGKGGERASEPWEVRHGVVVARQAAGELSRLVPSLRQRAARESEACGQGQGQGRPEVQLELQEQEAAVSHWWSEKRLRELLREVSALEEQGPGPKPFQEDFLRLLKTSLRRGGGLGAPSPSTAARRGLSAAASVPRGGRAAELPQRRRERALGGGASAAGTAEGGAAAPAAEVFGLRGSRGRDSPQLLKAF